MPALAMALGLLGGCHGLTPGPLNYPPVPAIVCPPLAVDPPPPACPNPPAAAAEVPPAGLPEPSPIDLPSALRLVNAQNPQVALARERIREAFAVLERAEVLWLPDLELGPEWLRHDGQIQRFNGEIRTVSRSSLWVGGGPALNLDLSEAIFTPLAARQVVVAREAGAAEVTNDQMLDAAIAYIDLLQVFAEFRISDETLANARRLLEITESHEKSGTGAPADTARARTEVEMRERERTSLIARAGVASARLVRVLQLPPDQQLRPVEPALVPIALVPEKAPLPELLAQALMSRPELEENRALIRAALERWRAAKVAPLVPNLTLAYAAGGFGGGPNAYFSDFNGRSDFTAAAQWQLTNFGLGDLARTRERRSQWAQVNFRQAALEARVSAEVMEAFSVAFARRREMASAQRAVAAARDSYRLNEERVRRAPEQGRPIELLQAIQALNRARLEYLQVVADYNRAQFRLYTALGTPPLCALQSAADLPITEPTAPPSP